jgi:hypothetical protein
VTEKLIPSKKSSSVKVEAGANEAPSDDDLEEGRVFTDEKIKQLAINHNLYCDSIISLIDITSSDVSIDVVDITNGYLSQINSELDLSTPITYSDLTNTQSAISSYVLNKSYFNELLDDVENIFLNLDIADGNCYADLENRLNEIKSEVPNNLNGTDIDGAYALIETLKKSADFWLPTAAGGSGDGYKTYEDYLDLDPDYVPGMPMGEILGRTALADGCSMFTLCMILGVGGAINPAFVPASLFLYFGAGVAGASVNKFFDCLT